MPVVGIGVGRFVSVGPLAAGPARMPAVELMKSGESCAMRAGRAQDCVRDLAGGLVTYGADPEACIAWWRTTAGRLGLRLVARVLGPHHSVSGDRGLIFQIVRTARVAFL